MRHIAQEHLHHSQRFQHMEEQLLKSKDSALYRLITSAALETIDFSKKETQKAIDALAKDPAAGKWQQLKAKLPSRKDIVKQDPKEFADDYEKKFEKLVIAIGSPWKNSPHPTALSLFKEALQSRDTEILSFLIQNDPFFREPENIQVACQELLSTKEIPVKELAALLVTARSHQKYAPLNETLVRIAERQGVVEQVEVAAFQEAFTQAVQNRDDRTILDMIEHSPHALKLLPDRLFKQGFALLLDNYILDAASLRRFLEYRQAYSRDIAPLELLEILKAAQRGERGTIQEMLRFIQTLPEPERLRGAIFKEACLRGDRALVRDLLEAGVRLQAGGVEHWISVEDYCDALDNACAPKKKDLELVQLLLSGPLTPALKGHIRGLVGKHPKWDSALLNMLRDASGMDS